MKRLLKFKLFENPNAIKIFNKKENDYVDVVWADYQYNICFSYYFGNLYIGDDTHEELFDNNFLKSNSNNISKFNYYLSNYGRGELSGRLFVKRKIITFWNFPENNKELKEVVKDLENKTELNIWNNDWYIEILKNESKNKESKNKNWGDWKPSKDDNIIYIPLENYKSSEKRSEKEIKIPHVLSPIEKEKLKKKGLIESPKGKKIKTPKGISQAQYRHKKTKYKYTESFISFVNEKGNIKSFLEY